MEVVSSPGRLNIIGDHTDYAGGLSLACAIEQKLQLSFLRQPNVVELRTNYVEGSAKFSLDNLDEQFIASLQPTWIRRVAAVGYLLTQRNIPIAGFSGSLTSQIPVGSGLSSSAAIALASCLAFAPDIDITDAVKVAQQSEWLAAGVRCGLLDQLSIAYGRKDHALLIDFSVESTQQIPVSENIEFWIIDSQIERSLADSAYDDRRQCIEQVAAQLGPLPNLSVDELQMLKPLEKQRARHVVTECARVKAAAGALFSGDHRGLGALMNESHESLRSDFEVSLPALDQLVEAARQIPGVLGARITGAGFGGCCVALCERGAIKDPESLSGKGWLSRPADGLQLLTANE